MTFDYDIENEDGEVLATVEVSAQFSQYYPAVTHRRPENCYPAEGGELERLEVYLDGRNITKEVDVLFGGDYYERIERAANDRFDPRKEGDL